MKFRKYLAALLCVSSFIQYGCWESTDSKNARKARQLVTSATQGTIAPSDERGIELLTEAIRLDPKYADAWASRGSFWFVVGVHQADGRHEYEQAIADYDQAILLDPDNAEYYYTRALYRNQLSHHDSETAEKETGPSYLQHILNDLTQSLKLDPKYFKSRKMRGNVFIKFAEYDKAINDFSEALNINRHDLDIHGTLAELYLWCPDPRYRDAKQALKHARRNSEIHAQANDNDYFVREAHGSINDALELLAFAYAEVGDYAEAIKQLEKTIAEEPGNHADKRQRMLESYKNGKKYEFRPEEIPTRFLPYDPVAKSLSH